MLITPTLVCLTALMCNYIALAEIYAINIVSLSCG